MQSARATLGILLAALAGLLLTTMLAPTSGPDGLPLPASLPAPLLAAARDCGDSPPPSPTRCEPARCGRLAVDGIVSPEHADALRALMDAALAVGGGGSGGVSILDLTSGAVSHRNRFADLFRLLAARPEAGRLDATALDVYAHVVTSVRDLIASVFEAETGRQLYLSSPTFFSRFNGSQPPATDHDEYWHTHVDTVAYPDFTYTGLVYLADPAAVDGGDGDGDGDGDGFAGGEFEFTDTASRIVPRKGRILVFSSGGENPHRVRRVTAGLRYALTISFTCDPARGIDDADFLARARAAATQA
ncbi:PKHD domain-containing transmembrane protein [Thecamonas trahens ATCC 50062]|uniref:PKHD domain-containing transmembrane protein n=1 Tax=Thecamonas trahens ATCC 50062 TaxID=461836 RepID=A0A0L0DB34_THETB|nr:PKHD domain-containing transmembrane protein [Thecamonas trahens ATCC 50062]KNC48508.1 PKHD domain-containing transmembrane protein [Thecamonas trahens ATCC 50062]|eukprot:XP_013758618.1 PKHD domain-containing transmembrane protein [Thecamonas trahens ATCC 50062]